MKITVIGAGTMGNGIAHTFAQYKYQCSLYDSESKQLTLAIETISKNLDRQVKNGSIEFTDKSTILNNLSLHDNLNTAVEDTDLVVEAIVENLDVKRYLFKEISAICKPSTILASNTSSISISDLAEASMFPENVIGMHFFNPVPVMTLVEVIKGKKTSENTISHVVNIAQSLGKSPIMVNDYPGFISNRILMPMINEAIIALEEGVAEIEAIDQIMKLGMSHPMGPLQLADFIGLDVCLNIMQVLHSGLDNDKYKPANLLIEMVKKGQLGKKSGLGFYKYN